MFWEGLGLVGMGTWGVWRVTWFSGGLTLSTLMSTTVDILCFLLPPL